MHASLEQIRGGDAVAKLPVVAEQVAHLVHDAKIEIAAVAVHSHKGSSK